MGKQINLLKVNIKDLENKTEEFVDKVFIDAIKSLLSKNILCETAKIVDMQEESVANQKEFSKRVAIITIPYFGAIRFSEKNKEIFEKMSKKHPENFIDRWNETKTDHYRHVIAVDIDQNDTDEFISQKLEQCCKCFIIQDIGNGLTEEELYKFHEDTQLSKLFPEIDWSGHYELIGRKKVWIPNQENKLTSEEIRNKILENYKLSDDRVLDENNELWDRTYFEKHQKFLQEQNIKQEKTLDEFIR